MGSSLSDEQFEKQAQEYYREAPAIVLGSGASAAHGISGMGALAERIVSDIDVSDLPEKEQGAWGKFCESLDRGVDLETALTKHVLSEELTSRIIRVTWKVIKRDDENTFLNSLQVDNLFPLRRLLDHMFKSTVQNVSIVTTNYDRLAEYACDLGRFPHYTGFTHGYYRQRAAPMETTVNRRVDIWKVHGSLDWFESPLREVVAISGASEVPENYSPQIVTPGAQKYQKTHLEPFRTVMQNADEAIGSAKSYLCIGYGFNDEHIQPKLMANCKQHNIPITIITRSLSHEARQLIDGGEATQYLAIERGDSDDESIVYSSQRASPLRVDKNLWSLEGYLSLIM